MKLVFCGTPHFAVPSLETVLAAGHEVALVLTQPDRPAGRGMELRSSPVKQAAEATGLPILQPEKIKNNVELREQLEAIAPDAICVVAYGRIIPTWMLELPRFGNINVHGSLLPKYRGAAPIQWAIANGETETGVTTMLLNEGLDTGDTLIERRLAVLPEATSTDLYPQLAAIGAEALVETLRGLESGVLKPKPQDHALATLAPIIKREDGLIDPLRQTAEEIHNRWRGFQPWPGVYSSLRGKRFLLQQIRPEVQAGIAAGSLAVNGGKLLLGCAVGTALELAEVQMEGKPKLPGAQFARDFQVKNGERLG